MSGGRSLRWRSGWFYQTFFLENADKHRESDWFLRESEGGAFSQTVTVSVIDDIFNSCLDFRYKSTTKDQAVDTQLVEKLLPSPRPVLGEPYHGVRQAELQSSQDKTRLFNNE